MSLENTCLVRLESHLIRDAQSKGRGDHTVCEVDAIGNSLLPCVCELRGAEITPCAPSGIVCCLVCDPSPPKPPWQPLSPSVSSSQVGQISVAESLGRRRRLPRLYLASLTSAMSVDSRQEAIQVPSSVSKQSKHGSKPLVLRGSSRQWCQISS